MRQLTVRCWHCPATLSLGLIRTKGVPIGEVGDGVLKIALREKWASEVVDGDLRITCPACQAGQNQDTHREFELFRLKNLCTKCGSKSIATRYCTGNVPQCDVRAFRDHLHRTCGECGYDWKQETKDHAPIESPPTVPVRSGAVPAAGSSTPVPERTGCPDVPDASADHQNDLVSA